MSSPQRQMEWPGNATGIGLQRLIELRKLAERFGVDVVDEARLYMPGSLRSADQGTRWRYAVLVRERDGSELLIAGKRSWRAWCEQHGVSNWRELG